MICRSEGSRVLALALLLGCGTPEPAPLPPTPTPPTAVVVPPSPVTELPTAPPTDGPCAVPVALEGPTAINALQEGVFGGVGGVGPYRFSLLTNTTGATLQPTGGRYQAGPVGGVDVVRVEDLGCANTFAAQDVVVGEPLEVRPDNARIPFNASFALQIEGGTGPFACQDVAVESGSIDAACTYTAGTVEGIDVLEVLDVGAQQAVQVTLIVDGAPLLEQSHLLVAGTGSLSIPLVGGSGTITGASQSFMIANGAITALVEGVSEEVLLVDPVTLASASVVLSSAAAQVDVLQTPDGALDDWEEMLTADFDGDGFDELIVGDARMHGSRYLSGGVGIFTGSATGFSFTRRLLGQQVNEGWGVALAAGDFNGDGTPELALGADRWNANVDGVGRVLIYGSNLQGAPLLRIRGTDALDGLGQGLAVCDLDGDGFDDLLVGVPGLENRTVVPTVTNSGAVQVHRGSATGLSATPDVVWYGRVFDPVAGIWVEATSLRAGSSLATGDVDGDGGCDVLIGAYQASVSGSVSGGAVLLVRGEALLAGGLPSLLVGTTVNADRLGRRVGLVDLDEDGADDLVASAPLGGNRNGEVVVFLDPAGRVSPYADVAEADIRIVGSVTREGFGAGLDVVRDAPGPGLLIGSPDTAGGRVSWFDAASLLGALPLALGSVDATTVTPGQGRFGTAVIGLPDNDLDEVPDLAVVAGSADRLGTGDGQLWFRDGTTATELVMPQEKRGLFFGTSVAWYGSDLLVGAIGASASGRIDVGRVHSLAAGVSTLWNPPASEAANDLWGTDLQAVGDLDGDGLAEFVSSSPNRVRNRVLPAPFVEGTCTLEAGYSLAGAIWVHKGTAAGPEQAPRWAVFGDRTSARLQRATSLDFNGDGTADLAVGGLQMVSANGGVLILPGGWSTPPAGTIQVVCDGLSLEGTLSGSQFGSVLAGLPDVDGDGCDELVVGANRDNRAGTLSGAVYVIWGRGPTCSPARVSTLTGDQDRIEFGTALAAGGDPDGDGLPDLLVGAPKYTTTAGVVGAAWLVTGELLRADLLAADHTAPGTQMPLTGPVWVVLPTMVGSLAKEAVGTAVAFSSAPDLALVGAPGAGGGQVHGLGVDATGNVERRLLAGGETGEAAFGASLATRPGWLAVGAPWSGVENPDSGAVYAFPLPE